MFNDEPRRPYRTFEEFRRYRARYCLASDQFDVKFFACAECNGYGKVRNPDDRDCIEGYKLAPWYKCTACNGVKTVSKQSIMHDYRKSIAVWRINHDKWRELDCIRRKALRKLTAKEKKALGLC